MTGKTATGPGFRDLLRAPSGFGGRPGGRLSLPAGYARKRTMVTRRRRSVTSLGMPTTLPAVPLCSGS